MESKDGEMESKDSEMESEKEVKLNKKKVINMWLQSKEADIRV